MPRVNLVNPLILADQHLVAERLELTFVLSSARRSLASRNGLSVGEKYVLGKGHILFFHDKVGYLARRFRMLTKEMQRRGMKPSMLWPDDSWAPDSMYKDYRPTAADKKVVMKQLKERLLMKPSWYRYTYEPGKTIQINKAWIKEYYGNG